MSGETGTIFNIQKFSVHDGPGIRTTVFFKGCPLRCQWCHNPEGQHVGKELVILQSRCFGCGMCVAVCPEGAIASSSGMLRATETTEAGKTATTTEASEPPRIVTDREKCTICGKCADVCPVAAREIAGKEATSDWVMEQILKDRMFYEQSGGGATFSGGEPLMQPEFLRELLIRCKDEDINTAVDTSGCAPWEEFEQVAPLTDIFLYDVKMVDPEKHAKYTGASNKTILDNLVRLSRIHDSIIARIPIVPGVNDDDKNIRDTGKFLTGLNIRQVNILPYHNMGSDKYTRLGMAYSMEDTPQPENGAMLGIKEQLEKFGLTVKIGG